MYRGRYSRQPYSRNLISVLFARVRISATGGGRKIAQGGVSAAVIVTASGAGFIVDARGGSQALVDIIVQAGGRRLAEDLYFIEEPSIQAQGILATHVTVRSPTHEYTAEIPDTPLENTIERLVGIDEGNEATCQQVAEGLLDRWGREQLSITGRVPLVVTLRFKEFVKVFIPSAGIDDDFVMQKKEHELENFETRVTLGDIILSDEELLSRIIEEIRE